MSYPYNLTNFSSATDLFDVMQFADEVIGGWLGLMILLSLFIISYWSLKNYGSIDAFFASSFFTFVISLGMAALDLISFHLVAIIFVFLSIGAVMMVRKNGK